MDLDHYRELPEGMKAEDLRREFERVLATPSDATEAELLEALLELADRQWHTYERISADLAARVSSLLLRLWSPQSADSTEQVLVIVGHLGLQAAYESILGARESSPPATQRVMDETAAEFGANVADPYRDL